eukprot:NODE_6_length_70510_cov_1.054395.p42 type:complete len:209 gc:universal NODE_6_length_70510_cov_1.054395:68720-68094(-)
MLGHIQKVVKLPNALRHELKFQFLLHVNFVHIAEKAFAQFSDLQDLFKILPDEFKKHINIEEILKDFEAPLLTNDLRDVSFPCELNQVIKPPRTIPETFKITHKFEQKVYHVSQIFNVEYEIETDALNYVAHIEDRPEWIIKGMFRKRLQKSDSIKLQLQPLKVGMLLLPDCFIDYDHSSLLIRPSKGMQVKVLPEMHHGMHYFSHNE